MTSPGVAINGFGRIGRNVLRAIAESGRTDIEVVGINDLGPGRDQRALASLSIQSMAFPGHGDRRRRLDQRRNGKIKVLRERDPTKLPWKDLGRRHRRWSAPGNLRPAKDKGRCASDRGRQARAGFPRPPMAPTRPSCSASTMTR